jgi:ABC-type Fe3+ transport system substrate-binding protein
MASKKLRTNRRNQKKSSLVQRVVFWQEAYYSLAQFATEHSTAPYVSIPLPTRLF